MTTGVSPGKPVDLRPTWVCRRGPWPGVDRWRPFHAGSAPHARTAPRAGTVSQAAAWTVNPVWAQLLTQALNQALSPL